MREIYQYLTVRFGIASPDEGATAVEYGIMVALIAIVIIVAVALVCTSLEEVFDDVATALQGTSS